MTDGIEQKAGWVWARKDHNRNVGHAVQHECDAQRMIGLGWLRHLRVVSQ
jgi:hypothetical protein